MSPPVQIGADPLVERNAGIDVVRGISIILVLLHHTALRIPLMKTVLAGLLPNPLLTGLSWDGPEAVFVFFVVSGYLITRTSIARWGALGNLDLRAFHARRFARIAPCLLVLLAVLSGFDLAHVANYTITRSDQSLPGALLSAIGLYLNWYEGHTWYLPGGWDVLWSLSIEEVSYIAFPLICLVLGRSRAGLIVLFAALAVSLPFSLNALSGAPEVWQEKAYLPGIAAIAMGVCAALGVSCGQPARKRLSAAWLGWAGTLVLAALFGRKIWSTA